MSERDLEKLVNDYLIEKFGSKYGNGSAKQAFIDGCKIALSINPVVESFYCENTEEDSMLSCGEQCDFCKKYGGK